MAIKRNKKTQEVAAQTEVAAPVKKRATHRSTRATQTLPSEQVEKAPAASANITEEIAKMAYYLWLDRSGAAGSPDADWFRAEKVVRTKYGLQS